MTQPPCSWAVRGFFYPFKGFRFILQHLRLFTYVMVPVALNAVLFGLFAWFVAAHFSGWLEHFLPEKDTWYWAVLFYAVFVLLFLVLLLVVIYAFTLVGNIILGPFNDMLSGKVEFLYTGSGHDEPFTMRSLLKDIARSLKVEAGKLILYLGGLLVLLFLHLIPVAGSVLYGVLITLYTLFFLGWEYLDYSMERWKYSFRQKVRAASANLFAFIGFGAGASLMLFIPFVNLMAIPMCAVGATLLYCDLRTESRLPQVEISRHPSGAPPPERKS